MRARGIHIPWYLTVTTGSKRHGLCVLCNRTVSHQRRYLDLLGNGSMHVVCGKAFQEAYPDFGLDIIWLPNGLPTALEPKRQRRETTEGR